MRARKLLPFAEATVRTAVVNWREARDDRETFCRARAYNVWVSTPGTNATFQLFCGGDAVPHWCAFYRPRSLCPAAPMHVAAPIRLPGSGIQVVESSMPILTIREAPVPPAWALTSTEPQIMARQIEPRKHPGAKIVKVQKQHTEPTDADAARRQSLRSRWAVLLRCWAYLVGDKKRDTSLRIIQMTARSGDPLDGGYPRLPVNYFRLTSIIVRPSVPGICHTPVFRQCLKAA